MSWRTVRVEELASPERYALATGPFGSAISAKFFRSSGVPVLRGSNLSNEVGTRLSDDGLVFIEPELAAQFERSVARRGDLVFTCWGTIDQVGLVDDRAGYDEYVVSNKQMKLTPDPKKADARYLYYYFSSPEVRESIVASGIGSSVPGFNLGQLRSMEVPLPPLDEQRAIAEVLGCLDDKVELHRQMNHTLEEMASVLFKSWFIDFDPIVAKAHGGRPFGMDAATGALFPSTFDADGPAGWRTLGLRDFLEVNPRRKLEGGGPATYLDMSSAPTQGHAPATIGLREPGSGVRFANGDTLLAKITPCLENGKAAFVDFLQPEEVGWGSTEFIVMRPRAPIPLPFAYLLARYGDFREHAIQSMTGSSGRQRVALDSLERWQMTLPVDARIWRAFGDAVEPWFELCGHNSRESRTLTALRDTLLPKLLSGEVRVKQAEKLVGAAL